MADKVILCAGTRKGLFVFESSRARKQWKMRGPFLIGWKVYHAMVDTRSTPRIYASCFSEAFGTTVMMGDVAGKKFAGSKTPPVFPKLLSAQKEFADKYGIPTAERIWHVEPGRPNEKTVLYAGTAPAGLFRSEDSGESWQPVPGLNDHPTRKDWMPGAGGMAAHTIQLDSHTPGRMYVAISAAGTFRSDDEGKTWNPVNKAVAKYVGAPPETEVGTCVHKMLVHPKVPGRLFQQNHVGVYRSDDSGDTWYRIDKGLPFDYGFPLALNPNDPETCYVVPLRPEEYAFRATDEALCVYAAKGKGWKKLGKGLPSEGAFVTVLREGLASDSYKPCGVYLGTENGQVYASADEGRSWKTLAGYLPPVLSVSVAVV